MRRHRRTGVTLSIAALLLGGCDRSPTPAPSPASPSAAATPAPDAEPAAVAAPQSPSVGAVPPPSTQPDPAPPAVETIDLEALAATPSATLPGTLVRRGRYDVRQSMLEGELVVAMTEELTIHELGGRFVGRIASQSDNTPMPPSFVVFATDDLRHLQHVIWRGLQGTSAVEHELSRASFRTDGTEVEIVRTKSPLSSSTEQAAISGAWTLRGPTALEYLPLWSVAPAARSAKAEWSSLGLEPDSGPERIQLEPRGKKAFAVGGHEIDTWHYKTAKKKSAPSVELWIDEQGLVMRRLEVSKGELETRWDTIYVPLPGDPLSR
jgi:hypothetical protein